MKGVNDQKQVGRIPFRSQKRRNNSNFQSMETMYFYKSANNKLSNTLYNWLILIENYKVRRKKLVKPTKIYELP
ncbi:hypothetical protein VIGAN_08065200 [Vigna angularis var. angularis]|uniref:Uncharacterized protein n=1 Tax=Vigna angularis var. angularis TaxID=157739 RepID=A0A0S3SML5_PHAAN|nr:hypothetical protein VIGAN_08065200 [Vigna angularis var. angularis]